MCSQSEGATRPSRGSWVLEPSRRRIAAISDLPALRRSTAADQPAEQCGGAADRADGGLRLERARQLEAGREVGRLRCCALGDLDRRKLVQRIADDLRPEVVDVEQFVGNE